MFCTKCGKEISDQATFCTGCGSQTKTAGGSKASRKPQIPALNKKLLSIIGTVIILIIVLSIVLPSSCGNDSDSTLESDQGTIIIDEKYDFWMIHCLPIAILLPFEQKTF